MTIPVWPDAKLEAEMIRDAQLAEKYPQAAHDCECNTKALLARIRELEKEATVMREALERFSRGWYKATRDKP